jgi:hypothetical protein
MVTDDDRAIDTVVLREALLSRISMVLEQLIRTTSWSLQ